MPMCSEYVSTSTVTKTTEVTSTIPKGTFTKSTQRVDVMKKH